MGFLSDFLEFFFSALFSLKLNSISLFALVFTSVLQFDETPTASFMERMAGNWMRKKFIPKADIKITFKFTQKLSELEHTAWNFVCCQNLAVCIILSRSVQINPTRFPKSWSIGNRIFFLIWRLFKLENGSMQFGTAVKSMFEQQGDTWKKQIRRWN